MFSLWLAKKVYKLDNQHQMCKRSSICQVYRKTLIFFLTKLKLSRPVIVTGDSIEIILSPVTMKAILQGKINLLLHHNRTSQNNTIKIMMVIEHASSLKALTCLVTKTNYIMVISIPTTLFLAWKPSLFFILVIIAPNPSPKPHQRATSLLVL